MSDKEVSKVIEISIGCGGWIIVISIIILTAIIVCR